VIELPINGSELIDNPFTTIFSSFTDLLGTGFYLIPLSFICVALYVKTRNAVTVSAFMIGSGLLLSGGTMFSAYPEMALVYLLFTGLGFVGLIVGIFFMRRV